MHLYRDLIQAGLIMFVRHRNGQKKRCNQKMQLKQVAVKFTKPRPPSSPPPAIRALGNIADETPSEEVQVFQMYTRSKAAANAGGGETKQESHEPHHKGKREHLFVKLEE